MEIVRAEKSDLADLAGLADRVWHEYFPCILSEEQIGLYGGAVSVSACHVRPDRTAGI